MRPNLWDCKRGLLVDASFGQQKDGSQRGEDIVTQTICTVLYHLGHFYNEAYVIVENNSHGILTCTRLIKDMAYSNAYLETQLDRLTERETIKLGFTTTAKTKPLIIDQLRASMREGELELNDKTTIREMLTYIVTESGAMEAEAGCHDDTVMALALVNHIHEGAWEPVETPDELYIEMV